MELAGPVADIGLPVHALLRDSKGRDYALVIAAPAELAGRGWPWQVLDAPARPGQYYLVKARRAGGETTARQRVTVLHDDGVQWIVAAPAAYAESLAALGFAIARVGEGPMTLRPAVPAQQLRKLQQETADLAFDPVIAEMIDSIQESKLRSLVSELSGVEPCAAGGEFTTIATRNTDSGVPAGKARQYVFALLQELGLSPYYHQWTDGRTSWNVVGTLPGVTTPGEIVLVTAHLDDEPGGSLAPGADDNASGSAAVLAAARAFCRCRFDRTIRFVLFMGEEQGLLGSSAYAADVHAIGDNIVAVLNFDMIAWNGTGGPVAQLHTRVTSDPGYPGDLTIASAFINVVATYGLSGSLTPSIVADSIWESDHSRFWNYGYPAVLAIEEYPTDFNPYYHSVYATLWNMNTPYFTAFTKAAIGTVAALAHPANRVPFDAIEVANGDWIPGGSVGVGTFVARHEPDALDGGPDGRDIASSNAPANPLSTWLGMQSVPYGTPLQTDARATNSETIFSGQLIASAPSASEVACTNRLRFRFPADPASNRLYSARVRIDGRYVPQSNDFESVVDLRSLPNGFLELPGLVHITNGTTYGTCEIASWLLRQQASNLDFRILSATPTGVVLRAAGQAGTRFVDTVEYATNLPAAPVWSFLSSSSNTISPDLGSFTTGWSVVQYGASDAVVTNAAELYLRLQRQPLEP